jgi:uncharacterized protein involved in exopolysaccharide biosynthesis
VPDQVATGVTPPDHGLSLASGLGGLTLSDYLKVVRRRKWTILYAVVLVQLLAVVVTLSQTRVYEATAQVCSLGRVLPTR